MKTDMLGAFRFDTVAEGSYSIEVQREGFKNSVAMLRVTSRPLAPLRIALALADVASEISIAETSNQVSSDTSENRDAATVDHNLLEQLPTFDRDYVATMSAFLDPGAIGAGGTQLIVDGMQVNSVGVSASAIQEIRINQNPYAAEFSRPGKGRLEIITKAATSNYHGGFNFTFRDSVLNARDPFALVRAPEQRRIYEGSLSGPLGNSKTTSFLFSGLRQEDDLQAIVFARNLSGDVRETAPTSAKNTQISFRVSHQIDDYHSVSWQYNDRSTPTVNQGVGGVVLPEAAFTVRKVEREIIFNDLLTLPPRWSNHLQILIGRAGDSTSSLTSAPQIVVQDAFTSGGAQKSLVRTENHIQGNDIMNWSGKKHFVKFGVNVPDWSRRGLDDYTNFGGTFLFATLQDYAANHAYAFRQQQGSGHVVFWQEELGGFVEDTYKIRPNISLYLGLRYNWQNYLHDNNNLSPRLAFAYSPGKGGKTVLRGGFGTFYDRTGERPIGDVLLHNGQRLLSYLITDPSYPNPFLNLGALEAQPTDIARFDPSIHAPYSIQYSIGVERQVAKRTTVSANYRASIGVSLFRSRDANAPVGPDYLIRPDSALGVFRQIESSGRQRDDALDLTLRGNVTHYFSGLAQYTLNRSLNNTGGITWFPANQYDLTGEWSRADFDQRHRLNLLGSFNMGKWLKVGTGLAIASGKPYSLTTGQDTYRTGLANARPPGVSRNSLEGPGYADLDLRWSKDFYFNKTKKEKGPVTTFSFDAFNVLNHVNYVSYIGNLSSPFFGQAVSALPTRRLQVTLGFKF